MRNLRYFTTTLAFTLISIMALTAQRAEFGVKAGFQMSDISATGLNLGFEFLDPQMTPGVTAGLYAELPMGNGLYFAPELNYTQKGFRVSEGVNVNVFDIPIPLGAEAITKLHYIETPLTMKYKFGSGATTAYVKAGPTVGYAMDGTVITRINSFIDFDVARVPLDLHGSLYNALEVGALVGAGFEVNSGPGKFFMDVNFQHGLTDLINEPVVDFRVKNKSVGVGAGYAFRF